MRIDVVTVFPDYLRPLELSLPGRAREKGLIEVEVHDLRTWTHDVHRTVDDAPYGGGAGMVMKPEPWGEALDAVAPDGATLVVPTPAGEPFHQRLAAELATREQLVFACGRYEGIDARVAADAARRLEVREVSLGDYVLNGGEVAALAVIEAVVRLLPGVLGNAASLAEESHGEDGLLEYPVFTRPVAWRDLAVPDVLLSGDHARIASWRAEESRRRTVARRPDLLTADVGGWRIEPAAPADAAELLVLQLACWVPEALVNDDLGIPPLHEGLAQVQAAIATGGVRVVRSGGRLVGSVRGRLDGETWEIGRLMVAPDLRGVGLGRLLLEHAESLAPTQATTYRLFTGVASEANLRRYRRAGYRRRSVGTGRSGPVTLEKPITAR
ncbi:tRNA (guanosine(37)-N1)-methyltransferase TrmD [Nocardioides mangrovicus]|uniref:tRNA (guanine-N(1)-)-methyltransferase n=1 Tax=Nocardioides mangrovicus TaxID=2478913 RepID=A0A3L8P322_9ACTN|nr:tRNA (guanosine(37)-N1)-methyltransferase TrmD [Nocardioides mangrovicus]RLV48828.1 tRNA (guanosine(37)-N1)-methyltransferase TrmD [Nocardioides mangrovicus]